jgi:uncharacterized protein
MKYLKDAPLDVRESVAPNHKAFTTRRDLVVATVAAVAATSAPTPLFAQVSAKPQEAPHETDVGTIWWNELLTRDPERARTFYSKVIGWTAKPVALDNPSRPPTAGEKEYLVFASEAREAAGAMKTDDAEFARGGPAMWLTYIQVENVDTAVFRAVQVGGKLVSGPYDLPNVGRIAIVEDLEGARVGLVTPAPASVR